MRDACDCVPTQCRIAITPEGREAVVTLSRGDMRKCLNILQVRVLLKPYLLFLTCLLLYVFPFRVLAGMPYLSVVYLRTRWLSLLLCCFAVADIVCQATHMAYDKVDMDEVYMCTGQPLPSDIMDVTHSLLNDSFEVADESTSRALDGVLGSWR